MKVERNDFILNLNRSLKIANALACNNIVRDFEKWKKNKQREPVWYVRYMDSMVFNLL